MKNYKRNLDSCSTRSVDDFLASKNKSSIDNTSCFLIDSCPLISAIIFAGVNI